MPHQTRKTDMELIKKLFEEIKAGQEEMKGEMKKDLQEVKDVLEEKLSTIVNKVALVEEKVTSVENTFCDVEENIDRKLEEKCVKKIKEMQDRISNRVDDQGSRTTPSYVTVTETERLIGDAVKYQISVNPSNNVFDAERLIGRRLGEISVQSNMKHWPGDVINDGGKPKMRVEQEKETKVFSLEDISLMALSKMKEPSEAYLGKPVVNTVVAVLAYCNDFQRQAIEDARTSTGLVVLRSLDKLTATVIAYGLGKERAGEGTVLTFDPGGKTFEVSISTIEDGTCEVKSTAEDTHLAGEDFNKRMINRFVLEFKRKHQEDLISSKRTCYSSTQASIEIDSLFDGIDFYSTIIRARFEELNAGLFRSTLEPVAKVLRDMKLYKAQVHDIALVGGSTCLPCDLVLGRPPDTSSSPEEYLRDLQARLETSTTSLGSGSTWRLRR